MHGRSEIGEAERVDSLEVIGERSRGISNFLLGEPMKPIVDARPFRRASGRIEPWKQNGGLVAATMRDRYLFSARRGQASRRRCASLHGAGRKLMTVPTDRRDSTWRVIAFSLVTGHFG